MNKDEIMQLGMQAKLCSQSGDINDEYDYEEEIIAFANLIAAAEREACLQAVGDLIRKHRDEKDGDLEGYPDIFDAYEAIRARGQE